MSIVTGEVRREEKLFAALRKRLFLYAVADYDDWKRANEQRLKVELRFENKPIGEWFNFLSSGPYGLKPKQHMPILLVKPDVMIRLFAPYVKDYDWSEERIKK